jgi:hypothetical protein
VRNYGIQDLKMKLSAGYKPEGCNVSTETFHNIFSPTPYFNCPYPNGCSETLWYIGDVKPTLPIGANNIEFLPKDWWPFD